MLIKIICCNPFDALRSVENDDILGASEGSSMRAETDVDEGKKVDAKPIQILTSTPNDVTLVNEVQLAHEEPTSNVAGRDDEDNNNEVEEVYNETSGFMASKSGGGIGRKSLYERWKDDYDYNLYDEDDCEHLTDEQLAICDAFDIKVRCHTRCL
ncbi:hypothetical protein CTI12_AA207610 [Artemisia annua]|uniref:Uncharacterized protein n=1 Tax=Artemisia annua TaxID=35608 RepID=A0A2U1P0S9_ARTAN|nr:hypothetical protein CTI12_AA207610 [Artemisia annua]